MVKYAIIIEKVGKNYSAYCPDVPGCVAAADIVEETIILMADALKTHFKLMKDEDIEIPEPTIQAASIELTV